MYYKLCFACVTIFYAVREEDLAAVRAAAEADVVGFVEARRAEGLRAPFLVVQDFVADRLQVVAREGLAPERAEELVAWAAGRGRSGPAGARSGGRPAEDCGGCRPPGGRDPHLNGRARDMAGTYYKVCFDSVSVFYAVRIEDLAEVRAAAEAGVVGFVEARRAEGLCAPFLVVQDFIIDRLQIIASEGLTPERAEELTAWAARRGLPGLVGATEAAYRVEAPHECRARI